jgi:heme oxygenase (biliverdin-IX-beta and delta-forming)
MNLAHRALRAGTADAHARVDALFAGFDLDSAPGYAAMLAAHAGALLPIEAALDAGAGGRVIEDWPTRRRAPLLLADLDDLGTRSQPGESPDLLDEAQAAGALYVLEGSRFGGRIIARDLPPGLPRRYLDAGQAPENWRKLVARLDAILYVPAALDSAVKSARAVFAAFERSGRQWLKD